MARPVDARLVVEGELVCLTPVRVGGMEAELGVNLGLAENGRGEWYIPGTSLAGLARRITREACGEKVAAAVWGSSGAGGGGASLATVGDAVVELTPNAVPELRDGVGIDRFSGAAAHRVKYDQLVLPKGSRILFYLEVELQAQDGIDIPTLEEATGYLLQALVADDGVRLGAGKTRGMGRVRLDRKSLQVRRQDLNSREGILEVLRHGGRTLCPDDLLPGERRSTRSVLVIEIEWKPTLPTFVKAGHDGGSVDILPLVGTLEDGTVTLVLPGSSIKGALRAQAERIVRTVLDLEVPFLTDDIMHSDQVMVPLVRDLFGRAPDRRRGSKDNAGAAGALTVDDCYAFQSCARDKWCQIEMSEQASLPGVLETSGLGELQQAFHVAVDRWTGGAAKGCLYSVLEPHGLTWEPLRLTVDLGRLGERRDAALALLFLVLRDLARGWIPLGFGGNRGHGMVQVDRFRMRGEGLPSQLESLAELVLDATHIDKLPHKVRDHLTTSWQRWIDEHSTSPVAQ